MPNVRIEPYTPQDFEQVCADTGGAGPFGNLLHREFVNHYYAAVPWCRLYLGRGADGAIRAALGVEVMEWEVDGRTIRVGAGSNFAANQEGLGGLLFLHWVRGCDAALVFGGNENTHRVIGSQRWSYYSGVRTFILNQHIRRSAAEAPWRRAVRLARGWTVRRRSLASLRDVVRTREDAALEVTEEARFSAGLLPERSAFRMRWRPSIEHLSWRYGPGLSFATYRLFRILERSRSVGYVVLKSEPDRVLVAHGDAEEASVLANGMLLALAAISATPRDRREVVLTASEPGMQKAFLDAGFVSYDRWTRPLAFGSRRGSFEIETPVSEWLFSFDIGDNGLRAPFPTVCRSSETGTTPSASGPSDRPNKLASVRE